MKPRNAKRLVSVMLALSLMGPATKAWAWGWWDVAAVVVGAAVCVATGGIGVPVVAGLAVGAVGTVTIGDSVYDDIVASPSNPVGGPLIFQRPNPVANLMPPITDPETPPQMLSDLNAARQGFADALSFARGIRDACQRYYGARAEGVTEAMRQQAGWARQYLQLEEQASASAVGRFRAYLDHLREVSAPGPETVSSAASYSQFRDTVRDEGFPICLNQEMNLLHVTVVERESAREFIASASDDSIANFFSAYPADGAYLPDLLEEAVNQWEAQRFRDAIPSEILLTP